MNYVIIVNDNGELKTISSTEMEALGSLGAMEAAINIILDERSAEEERLAKLYPPKPGSTAEQRVADDTEHANRGQR